MFSRHRGSGTSDARRVKIDTRAKAARRWNRATTSAHVLRAGIEGQRNRARCSCQIRRCTSCTQTVTAGVIVCCSQFVSSSNHHVDRCSNPLPWDPLSSPQKSESFVFHGSTCLIRLIEFAALFVLFEEHMC